MRSDKIESILNNKKYF